MTTVKGFADTIAWYDTHAEEYAGKVESIPNIVLLDHFAHIVGKGGKVLDAGCAGGRDTKLLQDRGLVASGLDLSRSLLMFARSKYPDIEFVYGNFLDIPFKDNFFDGLWAHASLVHLETTDEVSRALGEFYRVMKLGGFIHLYVKQQQGQEKTSIIADTTSNHDRFFQWFTMSEVRDLLNKTGFTILEIEDNLVDLGGRTEVKWIYALAKKFK